MNLDKAAVEASEGSAPNSADVNGLASRIAVPTVFRRCLGYGEPQLFHSDTRESSYWPSHGK